MTIKDDTAKTVAAFASTHGKEKAALKFNMSIESVGRYMREARRRGIIDDAVLEYERRPNVLILDIETLPAEGWFWWTGKQYIGPNNILKEVRLLSYACKWLFEPEIYSSILTPEEAVNRDDRRISEDIWKFVDYADIVIAHNGVRFDMVMLNTFFLLNGLQPTSPYQIIDTLKVFWKQMKFMSNKQGYLNTILQLPQKLDHEGYEMWLKCARGDKEALDTMLEYNEQDVTGLEELYVKIRPWIKSHPNLGLYYDDMHTRCPNCGSDNLDFGTDKFYVTPMNKYSTVRCLDCGAIGRSRSSAITSHKRDSLISTVAR